MRNLLVVANTILGNEKAWSYQEVYLQSPGNRGFHRYQVIRVNRNGVIAEFKKDMGSAKLFQGVKQIIIPSEWEHTVDELMDIADYLRAEIEIDVKDLVGVNNLKLA